MRLVGDPLADDNDRIEKTAQFEPVEGPPGAINEGTDAVLLGLRGVLPDPHLLEPARHDLFNEG